MTNDAFVFGQAGKHCKGSIEANTQLALGEDGKRVPGAGANVQMARDWRRDESYQVFDLAQLWSQNAASHWQSARCGINRRLEAPQAHGD